MPRRPLTPRERVEARVVTGPLGHLWGGVADWVALLSRWGWSRARGRRLW